MVMLILTVRDKNWRQERENLTNEAEVMRAGDYMSEYSGRLENMQIPQITWET